MAYIQSIVNYLEEVVKEITFRHTKILTSAIPWEDLDNEPMVLENECKQIFL